MNEVKSSLLMSNFHFFIDLSKSFVKIYIPVSMIPWNTIPCENFKNLSIVKVERKLRDISKKEAGKGVILKHLNMATR